jgi:hypothetical protein
MGVGEVVVMGTLLKVVVMGALLKVQSKSLWRC